MCMLFLSVSVCPFLHCIVWIKIIIKKIFRELDSRQVLSIFRLKIDPIKHFRVLDLKFLSFRKSHIHTRNPVALSPTGNHILIHICGNASCVSVSISILGTGPVHVLNNWLAFDGKFSSLSADKL